LTDKPVIDYDKRKKGVSVMMSDVSNMFIGGAGILLVIVIALIPAICMGFVVKNLALKKGYRVSYAWGFFFGTIALIYWGLAPTHPELQAQIIAEGVRRANNPPQQ
jgi:hypothetical protein